MGIEEEQEMKQKNKIKVKKRVHRKSRILQTIQKIKNLHEIGQEERNKEEKGLGSPHITSTNLLQIPQTQEDRRSAHEISLLQSPQLSSDTKT